MDIIITIPGHGRHGGVRVIIEWANRLSAWHNITLLSLVRGRVDWMPVSHAVKWVYNPRDIQRKVDCLIITSPHTIHWINSLQARKKLLFCQMAEHLFHPGNKAWLDKCQTFYRQPHPMISISQWNIDLFKSEFGRTAPTYYVGNGVNLQDFPISETPKDHKTVLIEGWEGYNYCKDELGVARTVAKHLKADGYHIVAYGSLPIKTDKFVPHEYHEKPSTELMNKLYEDATVLVKASRYDARACAPMEAMTKGTVTARAIISGDDDLIHGQNALRCEYNSNSLYKAAKYMLENKDETEFYAAECRDYVQKYTWDYWMQEINRIITYEVTAHAK